LPEIRISVARVVHPVSGTPHALLYLGKVPEMGTHRIHGAHLRRRFARVALEAALLIALLLPWAAIVAWLFWRDALR
jgi:hypothetical protein